MGLRRVSLTILLLLLSVVLSACSESRASVELYFLNPDGTSSPKIQAEIARSEGERRLGLMYRKQMAANEGMLFIFPREAMRSFWMKNTYLELDMIFIDKDLKVVSVLKRAVPLSESPRKSEKPATYVLEVIGGQAEPMGIRTGSKLQIEENLPPAS